MDDVIHLSIPDRTNKRKTTVGPNEVFHTQSPQSYDGVIRWAERQIDTLLLLLKSSFKVSDSC